VPHLRYLVSTDHVRKPGSTTGLLSSRIVTLFIVPQDQRATIITIIVTVVTTTAAPASRAEYVINAGRTPSKAR
jgi:hypothetical protein